MIQNTPVIFDTVQQALTLIKTPSTEGAQQLLDAFPSTFSLYAESEDLEGQGMLTSMSQALATFFAPALEPPTEEETMDKETL